LSSSGGEILSAAATGALGGNIGTLGVATGMAAVRFLRWWRFWLPEEDLDRLLEERFSSSSSSLELELSESDSSAENSKRRRKETC
jgi:hypothetical protein